MVPDGWRPTTNCSISQLSPTLGRVRWAASGASIDSCVDGPASALDCRAHGIKASFGRRCPVSPLVLTHCQPLLLHSFLSFISLLALRIIVFSSSQSTTKQLGIRHRFPSLSLPEKCRKAERIDAPAMSSCTCQTRSRPLKTSMTLCHPITFRLP